MTISTDVRVAGPFLGSGTTGPFPFSYKVFAPGDVVVVQIDAANVESTLTLAAHYTISLNADQNVSPGGDVTLVSPLLAGQQLLISSDVPALQQVSLPNGGPYFARVIEDALDRLTVLNLQAKVLLKRGLRVPEASGTVDIPAAAARAGKFLAFDATGKPITLTVGTPGDAAALAVDLTDQTNAAKGAGMVGFGAAVVYAAGTVGAYLRSLATSAGAAVVGYLHTGTGAVLATLQSMLRGRINVAASFGAPTDGTTSATAAIQAAFNEAAARGVSEVYFPPGTYLLTNPNSDADYTCAVIISGLRNCVVRGAKGTKFIVNATGAGSAQFGMFRVEQCENVEFCGFEMDGSGITVNGTGANRSRGFVLVNYDVNNKANALAVLNKAIEFHHIKVSNIGGFVGVPPRSSALAATPYTDVLSVHDCIGANLIGQDHFVGVAYVRGLSVRNNRCVNDIATYSPIDNMMVDASQGCEVALVENNYAYGFWFGAKCETATGAGPSGTEIRPSKNVTFLNNVFEQIGHPTLFTIPGPSGGDTYGLKINGINCKAIGNTISARTIGVSGGGLAGGIQAVGTHAADSHSVVGGNIISGAQYGVNQNDTTPTTRKSTYLIQGNRVNDAITYGLILQSNVLAEDNQIHRSGDSAILVQNPNNTAVRRNWAFNCATANNPVSGTRVTFYQEGAGAYSGFQEWTGNIIIDERGGSAAQHGYFIRGGTTYSNALIFQPGYTTGLLTGVTVDTYVSADGNSLQRSGTTARALRTIQVSNTPASTAPWNGMPWNAGDRAVLTPPVVGSPKGWVCTVAGTPGTWVSEGNL